MVKYKTIKRFSWAETADDPIFIVTDKAREELKRIKD